MCDMRECAASLASHVRSMSHLHRVGTIGRVPVGEKEPFNLSALALTACARYLDWWLCLLLKWRGGTIF